MDRIHDSGHAGLDLLSYFMLCVHCQCYDCSKLRLTTFIKQILIDCLVELHCFWLLY